MQKYLKQLKGKGKPVLWCGDMNIARTPKDVHFGNPQSSSYSKKKLEGVGKYAVAGYTREEREDFEKMLKEGYTDVYRNLHPK